MVPALNFLTLDGNSIFKEFDEAMLKRAYPKIIFMGLVVYPLYSTRELAGDMLSLVAETISQLFRTSVLLVHSVTPVDTHLHSLTVYILSKYNTGWEKPIQKIKSIAMGIFFFIGYSIFLLLSPIVIPLTICLERKKSTPKKVLNPPLTVEPSAKSDRSKRFESVVGMKEFIERLNSVIDQILHPGLAKKYGIGFPSGLIFYGKPGCGKSHMAKKFAEELGKSMEKTVSVVEMKVENVKGSIIHESAMKLRAIFSSAAEEAKKNDSLSVIIIDEFDTLVPKIDPEYTSSALLEERSEFLKVFESAAEQRVLFIGTTNHLENIDKATIRPGRFDELIEVPLPDAETCALILREKLAGLPLDQTEFNDQFYSDYGRLCSENKLNIADIKNICSDLEREYNYQKNKRAQVQNRSQAASSQQTSSESEQIQLKAFNEKFERLMKGKKTQQQCY